MENKPEPKPLPRVISTKDVAVTAEEQEVMEYLAVAWNKYLRLPGVINSGTHPGDGGGGDDLVTFRQSINACHAVIGLRVAKRVNPEIWIH